MRESLLTNLPSGIVRTACRRRDSLLPKAAALGLVAVVVATAAPAARAAVVAEWQTISGGGGASWRWIGDTVHGFGVRDGALAGGRGDAYDNAATMRINGVPYYNPGLIYDRTGTVVTTNVASMSGLGVSAQFAVDPDSPTLRTIYHFTNSGDSVIAATMRYQTNTGADWQQTTIATSSGDTAFSTRDRWIITDDRSAASGDPTLNHVLYGPGDPSATPSAVSTSVFWSFGRQGVGADFELSIAGGETVSLMFFNQMLYDRTTAADWATVFDSNASLRDAGMLRGLSPVELSRIANWNVGPRPVPEPASLAVWGLIGAAGCVWRHRRRKRA